MCGKGMLMNAEYCRKNRDRTAKSANYAACIALQGYSTAYRRILADLRYWDARLYAAETGSLRARLTAFLMECRGLPHVEPR